MKIMILANFGMGLYKFRKELIEELVQLGHEVIVSLPNDEYASLLKRLGCNYIETKVDRRGTNPISDLKLLRSYLKIIKGQKPDVVLTYTIKPNIYGGIACRILKTPYLTNITGLGTSIENKGILQKVTFKLYKIGLKNSQTVFFQNEQNRDIFINNRIIKSKTVVLPGSGVNIMEYGLKPYPDDVNSINFLFIGRIMKAKGIDELLEAAKVINKKYNYIVFNVVGFCEEEYSKRLTELNDQGVIKYHGKQSDVHKFIEESNAIVLPSHHEGTSNVLLESAAMGRPIIASNIPGCRETFDEGVSGIGFEAKNKNSLIDSLTSFIKLTHIEKELMGLEGRKKIEKEYDRKIVIKTYISEINNGGRNGIVRTN